MEEHGDKMESVYKRLSQLEGKVTELESTRPFLLDMMERNTAAYEKLSQTLSEVEISIVKMSTKIDGQNHRFDEIKEELALQDEANKSKFKDVSKRIDSIEEKTQFDIAQFIKDKFPWIVVLIGAGIVAVSSVVSF